jgi:serine phosphatase RsbU (regulator of sigma subunit)
VHTGAYAVLRNRLLPAITTLLYDSLCMKNVFARIVNLGVLESDTFVLRNRLRVFNTALIAILLISCFYFAAAVLKYYVVATWITVYSVLSMIICLWLVSKRRFSFAFHFGMWYGFIFLSAFTFIFGHVTNSHYYFLFLPIVTNILFDNRRVIVTYFIATVLIMLTNVWLMDNFPPYYKVSEIERWFGYPNIPFTLLLVFLSIRLFKNENRKYAAQVEEQKEAIEEKSKAITDSINYAQRIQSALLAPAALMKKNLPGHFIFYKPKDIVSGDFYFAAESSHPSTATAPTATATATTTFWLCVGDCTGHGVPGAFMSLLNISILRELISEQKIDSPDQLLNKQRELIIRALNPDGAEEKGKDGMDCVLAKFDVANRTVQFACANNPVWIIRDGKLYEFRPDKQPVGVHEGDILPFTLHTWSILPGDCMYLFTDGFADQFGGPRGKKFKYAQLKEKLMSLNTLPVTERGTQLEEAFTGWKGNLEQIDDVLIIGVELT